MTDTKELTKLRALLAHWVKHNAEHGEEFRAWARKAGDAGAYLDAAAHHCKEANYMLMKALERLGGPLEEKRESHHAPEKHAGSGE
jgi:hypothetical protein